MQKAYRCPTSPDEDPEGYASLMEQWIYALDDYEPAALKAGYEKFIRQWRWQSWPAPGFMRELVHEAQKEINPLLTSHYQAPHDERTPTERQRMEYQLAQWRKWMDGKAPENTYPHSPEFDPGAQYDFIYDGSLGPNHRAEMIERMLGNRT